MAAYDGTGRTADNIIGEHEIIPVGNRFSDYTRDHQQPVLSSRRQLGDTGVQSGTAHWDHPIVPAQVTDNLSSQLHPWRREDSWQEHLYVIDKQADRVRRAVLDLDAGHNRPFAGNSTR